MAGRLPSALFSLLFPDQCRVCGEPLREVSRIPVCAACLREPAPLEAEYFCAACRTPFVNAHPLDETGRCALCRLGVNGFDAAYSYGFYEGALRKLIHLYKYEKIHTLSKPLGEFLARSTPLDEQFDIVVPVPLHWLRRWQRGFNQSNLLARVVARRRRIPVVKAVRRKRSTAPQAGLTNARRRANVRGVFQVRDRRSVAGKRILLVDDVLTTGATASACAQALKRAGARRVTLVTVARVDRRNAVEDYAVPVGAGAEPGGIAR